MRIENGKVYFNVPLDFTRAWAVQPDDGPAINGVFGDTIDLQMEAALPEWLAAEVESGILALRTLPEPKPRTSWFYRWRIRRARRTMRRHQISAEAWSMVLDEILAERK